MTHKTLSVAGPCAEFPMCPLHLFVSLSAENNVVCQPSSRERELTLCISAGARPLNARGALFSLPPPFERIVFFSVFSPAIISSFFFFLLFLPTSIVCIFWLMVRRSGVVYLYDGTEETWIEEETEGLVFTLIFLFFFFFL